MARSNRSTRAPVKPISYRIQWDMYEKLKELFARRELSMRNMPIASVQDMIDVLIAPDDLAVLTRAGEICNRPGSSVSVFLSRSDIRVPLPGAEKASWLVTGSITLQPEKDQVLPIFPPSPTLHGHNPEALERVQNALAASAKASALLRLASASIMYLNESCKSLPQVRAYLPQMVRVLQMCNLDERATKLLTAKTPEALPPVSLEMLEWFELAGAALDTSLLLPQEIKVTPNRPVRVEVRTDSYVTKNLKWSTDDPDVYAVEQITL